MAECLECLGVELLNLQKQFAPTDQRFALAACLQ
ncbi:hypothetical protein PSOLE_19430 [Pseudomonas oleovorans subsp. oleovorans]|jgi:hypothetical protein|uniref:Uncharacterized protein n=2 Tax=Ectopseudomonas oleovorans TaxID=301 RepID=A0A061D2A7_ECTOL|nr:hypothetical protein PSOLE_19430 [Pseudomonas oleovorans subsp. oleovorans]CDM40967.1 hypothetical protein BN5_2398 [Pseudomonas oleovorans CECT 5344]CDR91595.1 hypothetical protein PPSAL_2368 [Pseudomonas oleovorans]SEJ74788.1 hypothetical protein SAMN05216280_104112 [Pseudomonas oleovorans]SUD53106.1 Uncharacterised protein [Pseudomonas oleovorans]